VKVFDNKKMNNRKKTLVIFGAFYLLVATSLFLGLKKIKKNFSQEKLDFMLSTASAHRDKTSDLCKYRIIGDPEGVGKKYLKVNFWCGDTNEARSTLSLDAMSDKTVGGVLMEYARIIGFDYKIIEEENWTCLLNDQPIVDRSTIVVDAATIDCFKN
jgi:hypothetical protein